VDFRAGYCNSCSMTNSFVTNAVLIEKNCELLTSALANLADLDGWLSDLLLSELKMKFLKVEGRGMCAVALLGWLTPGAATEGVTPQFFSSKNLSTFFCSLLSLSLSLFIAFTRVSPPRGCHPTPFSPVRPRIFTIFL